MSLNNRTTVITGRRLAVRVLIGILAFVAMLQTGVLHAQQQPTHALGGTADEMYANAQELIDQRDFAQALMILRVLQSRHPGYNKIDGVQTRIAVLHEARDAGNALVHYLSALDKRDASDIDGAISTLDFIIAAYPEGSLQDDALYLKAYLQIMDRFEFENARLTLRKLRTLFAESAYQDSLDYLDAIALEQLGQTDNAKLALEQLRDRHTAVSLPFGYHWPGGTVLSRFWFDRANSRLKILQQVQDNASQLTSTKPGDAGTLDVNVIVDGVDLALRLTPSPLADETDWLDGVLQQRLPPEAGVYVGTVVGDDQSWVRAVIVDDSITGAVQAFGQQYTMRPGTLLGTLDYYRPRSASARAAGAVDSTTTDIDLEDDGMAPPAASMPAFDKRSKNAYGDIRVVPISVVIDGEFNRYHGGRGLSVALNQLNVADGVYRQFGIALSVDKLQVFADNGNDIDPLPKTPVALETYLRSFRDYRLNQRTLFKDSALTYLFTGKQRTDRTLGLAWINTLCRTDGYDVGITTPSAIGSTLLAHELGHSLGSQHDTDTTCNNDSTKLMWPNISARTQTNFSQCSSTMVEAARTKACLNDAIDLALEVQGGVQGVQFDLLNSDSALDVDALLVVETSLPGLVEWPAGCRPLTPTSGQCSISRLQAGEQRPLLLPVNVAAVSGDPLVTGHLKLDRAWSRDVTPSNDTVTLALVSQSTVDDHLNTDQGTTDAAIAGSTTAQPAAAKSGAASVPVLLVLLFGWLFRLTGYGRYAGSLRLLVGHRSINQFPEVDVP